MGDIRRRDDTLARDHPTAVMFLDESGAISRDRYFAVGCLKLQEPAALLRPLQKLRDRHHWYDEIHFVDLTHGALPFYTEVVDLVANDADAHFSCFVADCDHDPVRRFGSPWKAYERLALQLILGNIRPREVVTVLADNYSTPDHVMFERDLRRTVNKRLKRLAITSVVRLDSRAADPLQLVDLLTSAVAFEFRQSVGLAGSRGAKAKLAAHVREAFGVQSFLAGCRTDHLNVALYKRGAPPAAAKTSQSPRSAADN